VLAGLLSAEESGEWWLVFRYSDRVQSALALRHQMLLDKATIFSLTDNLIGHSDRQIVSE
jgi:hypothetical protein